jgi:hypothetical protein
MFVIEVTETRCMISAMRFLLLLVFVIGALHQSGCASGPDDPDQVQLPPTFKEQQQEARQKEAFARDLPKPRP